MTMKKDFRVALADRPSRVLAVVIGLIALAGIIIAFGIYQVMVKSHKARADQVTRAPGNIQDVQTGKESPQMTQLLTQEDKRRATQAQQTGQSMVATLTGMSEITNAHASSAPTSHKAHAPPPPPPEATSYPGSKPQPRPASRPSQPHDDEMQQAMEHQIRNIMAASKLSATHAQVYPAALKAAADAGHKAGGTGQGSPRGQSVQPKAVRNRVLIPASRLVYAVLDNAANSDVPGPISATILSGKFRGAKLLGTFAKAHNYNRIKFSTLHTKKYGTVSVQAVALSMSNGTAGIATSVNHHWLERYGGLFFGTFISGLGNAIAESGQTVASSGLGTITSSHPKYSVGEKLAIAGGAGAGAIGQSLASMTNIPTTVLAGSGTPVGVLFVSDVHAPSASH